MNNPISLSEAVKLAAVTNTSLTDAVKEAARGGADCTVISFPRHGRDSKRDIMRGAAGHPAAITLAIDNGWPAKSGPEREVAAPHSSAAARCRQEPASVPVEANPPVARRPGRWLLVGCAKLCVTAVLAFGVLVAGSTAIGSGGPSLGTAQKRVALVIGNATYQYASKLDNPRNDAADVSAALKRVGFQVTEGFDLDKAAFDRKVRDFAGALQGAEVAVFFYAGHGLQVSGHNYLVPVDAQLGNLSALDFEMVRLELVHRTMEREAKTNILFFDACRHNPLSRNLARAMGTRSAEIGRGLAQVEAGAGTLISFSTQPGNVALDGPGRNSPFAGALVRQLNASNDDVGAILISVRNDVMKETDRKQVPWEHSALTGRFYFNPASQPPVAASAPAVRSSEAAEAWNATKDSRNIAVLEAYVVRYKDTFYAELARARIEELRK